MQTYINALSLWGVGSGYYLRYIPRINDLWTSPLPSTYLLMARLKAGRSPVCAWKPSLKAERVPT